MHVYKTAIKLTKKYYVTLQSNKTTIAKTKTLQ